MEKYLQYDFQVFAPVRIGQMGGYAFLDTGATSSRILQSCAGDLPGRGSADVQGLLGTTRLKQCTLERVTFLGEDFSNVSVRIQPDEAAGFEDLPFSVVMTVGADILFQKALYLECAAGRVGFLDPVPPEWESRGQVVPLRFEKNRAFFSLRLGSRGLSAAFDLGAGYSVLNARCLETLQADLVEEAPEETSDATGAKAWIPVYSHPRLEINGSCLGGTRFLVMDLAAAESALGVAVDFIFGFNAMVGRNWVVDKQNHRMLLA